jgi:hypothetical protein
MAAFRCHLLPVLSAPLRARLTPTFRVTPPAVLLALLLTLLPSARAEAPHGNRLSARAQLRYEDVLTTRDGTRWRGKIVQRGDVFVIRLDGQSEVSVAKEQVVSVTRELNPALLHNGQFGARAGVGAEIGYVFASTSGVGLHYGGLVELGLTRNFGGTFEPELILAMSPLTNQEGVYSWQVIAGTRYYLSANRRAKPYTDTQLIVYGARRDLGLRTGPGILVDVSPNFGIGVQQGVSLLTQRLDTGVAAAIGYHLLVNAQGRF